MADARALPRETGREESRLAAFAGGLVEALAILAVLAVPLFVDLQSARRYEPIKVALVRAIAALALAALALRAVERRSPGRSWRDPLALAALGMALAWTASAALALSPRVALWGSYARLQGLASLLAYLALGLCVAARFRTRERAERLVGAAVAASVPVALIGLAQRYGLDPFELTRDPRRVASTLGAPNFAGAYVTLVLPLTAARLVGALRGERAGEAAACGFALALQALLLVFTQSRAPLLGTLGGGFVLGLLALLCLREPGARATRRELLRGCGSAARVGAAAAVGAAAGALAGAGLERVTEAGAQPFARLSTLGLGAGALLGGALALARLLRDADRRRSAWIAWLAAGCGVALCLLALNLRGTFLDAALDPLRRVPFLGRVAKLGATESGTVRVRLLIWGAALELARRGSPIGVPGSELAPPDPRHALRPWIGYGPDSLFETFAAVAPPELAHLEAGGSSADRAHNETLDALVTTGIVGTLATYLFWGALLARGLALLGWLADRGARRRLAGWAVALGLGGAAAALALGGPELVALGLPGGLLAAVVAHLAWEGARGRGPAGEVPIFEIGLFAALFGALIQAHFLFPTSPVHVPFWSCAGLVLAAPGAGTRVGELDRRGSAALRGAVAATALALLAFALLRRSSAPAAQDWACFAGVAALTWAAFDRFVGGGAARAGSARSAACAASGLALLVAPGIAPRGDGTFLLLLAQLLVLALATAWLVRGTSERMPLRRASLVAAPLVGAGALLAVVLNVDVARAGLALERGDRLALRGEWDGAIAEHERARALDPREPRHALALARDLQGKALDPRSPDTVRAAAWERGEAATRAARALAPYDADHAANLGRFEHSRAAAGEHGRFVRALDHFDEALALAPRDLELHRLAARTAADAGRLDEAAARLEAAAAIDPRDAATWILLGDARAALGAREAALRAHLAGLAIAERGNDGLALFADERLDERLLGYAEAGAGPRLVEGLEGLAAARPEDPRLALLAERARGAGGR